MYTGLGQDSSIYGPTPSQLGIETVTGDLSRQISGATPDVQNYISQLETWINAAGAGSSASQTATGWLNKNAKTVLIAAAAGVGVLFLMKMAK